MDQDWMLVNVDKRRGYPQAGEDILFEKCTYLTHHIRRIEWDPVTFSYDAIATAKARCTSSTLAGFPQELVDAVVSEITSLEDIVSLALTCSYFVRLLAQRVQKALKIDEAPWPGDRLILVGTYARSEPSWLDLTADDLRGIQSKLAPDYRFPGLRLYKLGESKYNNQDVFGKWRGALVRTLHRRMLAGPDMKSDIESADRSIALLKRNVDNQELVLRCLGTEEYVRESRLSKHSTRFSLNDAIFMSIQQDSRSSLSSISPYGCGWPKIRYHHAERCARRLLVRCQQHRGR